MGLVKVRRLICFLLVILVTFSIIVPTSASACYYSDGSMTEEELEKDIKYWWQGNVPNDNSLITGKSGSDTIGAGACSHFAMSYALVKMGILNPANGDTPITHIENARRADAFLVDWGYFDFGRVNELYPGVTYEGRDNNVSGLNATDGLTYVKGKMDEGYYVVAIVYGDVTNGHCIFFDGINSDGTVSIGDSAFYGITWEETYGATNTYFSYLELLKCSGKDFNSQPSIYDDNALRGATKKEVEEYNGLVQQWNLTGMPSKTNLAEGVKIPEFYDYKALTSNELENLQDIKNIRDGDKLTIFRVAKISISILGFLLILYALLLVAAYIFDRVNSFLNLSLVNLFTLGYLKVATKKDLRELGMYNQDRTGYITAPKLFVIVLVILIIGGLMISGELSYLVYNIITSGS